ncbi:MAG: CvpA family protein [Planctomycetes bacterium]|nr:CvpA family protein [Planctomycetota bacterium]
MEIFGVVLNWIDISVFGLILICFVFGVGTGLLMQVAGLLSIFAGMAAGFFGGPYVAGWISPWIQKELFANALGYFICFLVTTGIIRLIAHFLQNLMEKFKLKRYDRLAGGLIGALKGLLLSMILIMITGFAGTDTLRRPIDASCCGSKFMAVADWALAHPTTKSIIDKLKGVTGGSSEEPARESWDNTK